MSIYNLSISFVDVDGYLYCFEFSAITNKAPTPSTLLQKSLCGHRLSFLLDKYPRVVLLDH